MRIFFFLTLISVLSLASCTSDQPQKTDPQKDDPTPKPSLEIPSFSGKNAFDFVDKQVAFGPRVPNSAAHKQCGDWLIETFKAHGAEVIVQEADLKAYTGELLKSRNIIASYNPDHKRRILLAAHWDTRHIADHDSDAKRQTEPILGADDGGSGVAVLLEISKVIGEKEIDLGVDIVLFDSEDHGEPSGTENSDYTFWCLGSQYWSKNLHTPGYRPMYGILLDMVGSKSPRFPKEGVSMKYAPNEVNKVWQEAENLGYGGYFVNDQVQPITDDHLFVNEIAGIKMIDIINLPDKYNTETGFGHYWHTHKDNMSVISRSTLGAVGQTLLNVLYKESIGDL